MVMKTAFLTFEKFHGKKNIGSTRIRVRNLLKYWPEAHEYTFGEKPDVLIFQKVYVQGDASNSRYELHKLFDGIKILDMCDPDWLGTMGLNKGCLIKETLDAVDAAVVPTKAMQEFLMQLTDKPVRIIKDRFIVDGISAPRQHVGEPKKVIWFGYQHNADVLKAAINTIISMGLELTIMSDEDPNVIRWAGDKEMKTKFVSYHEEEFASIMKEQDICLLPQGSRPQDRFKSENKTVKAQLHGVPVATNREDLERLVTAKERNIEALEKWAHVKKEYDVRKSVDEYKELIKELASGKA